MNRAPRGLHDAQRWALGALAWAMCAALGCNAKLPEPESPAAKLYAGRCDGCHRVYAPGSLTFEMWKYQVERMQGEIVRHGLPPFTTEERDLVMDYLKRHAQ